MDHKLKINSFHDANAECSCGGWSYIFAGPRDIVQIEEEYELHYTPTLALQRAAVAALDPAFSLNLNDHEVEENGALDGDTLALFVWREIGESENLNDACQKLTHAISELIRVHAAIVRLKQ